MKKSLIYICVIFVIPLGVQGQVIVNGDFSNYIYKDVDVGCANLPGGGTAPGMGQNNVLNWDDSHGSPNTPFSWSDPYPNSRSLAASKGSSTVGPSEGFVGGYPFRTGRQYVITIHTNGFYTNALRVAMGPGAKPYNPNCESLTCNPGFSNGIKPTTPSSTVTYSWPGRVFGDEYFRFTYTPLTNHDWIWLYATHENYNHTCEQVTGTIVSVDVRPACNEELLTLSSPTVPYNNYGGYAYINIGASFGSGTIPTTITAPTLLEATRVITMGPGFVAAPITGQFIAQINAFSCGYEIIPTAGRSGDPGEVDDEVALSSKMTIPTVEYNNKKYIQHQDGRWEELLSEQVMNASIIIYPNPSSDHLLTIENILNSSISFETYDIGGKSIDKGNLSAGEKRGLDYSSKPAGIYYIKTITPHGVQTEKIVLQ